MMIKMKCGIKSTVRKRNLTELDEILLKQVNKGDIIEFRLKSDLTYRFHSNNSMIIGNSIISIYGSNGDSINIVKESIISIKILKEVQNEL